MARLTSASSLARVVLSYSWDDTQNRAYAAHTPAIEAYGLKEFQGGLSVGLDLRLAQSHYGYFSAFGMDRRDNQVSAQVNILHRRISYKGFAPRITAEWVANASNISAWSFTRKRVEIGFTKVF